MFYTWEGLERSLLWVHSKSLVLVRGWLVFSAELANVMKDFSIFFCADVVIIAVSQYVCVCSNNWGVKMEWLWWWYQISDHCWVFVINIFGCCFVLVFVSAVSFMSVSML